jgi:hypothetical protein
LTRAFGDIPWSLENGKTVLTTRFINLKPFAGKRVEIIGDLKTEFLGGFDFALCSSSIEKFYIETNTGIKGTGSLERNYPSVDLRLRAEIVNYYKRIGLAISYSYGLTNYTDRLLSSNSENTSRYLRVGMSYIIL